MKKTIGFLTLILLITVTVNAQRPQKERNRRGLDQTPEQAATLQSKKMALALDLDKKQQNAVFNLMKENAVEREKLRTEMKSKVQDGNKPNATQRYALQNDRLDRQIAHKAEMKKILSTDQFQKWEKMSSLKNKKGNHRMSKNQNFNKKQRNRSQNRF
jgi:hypothetical protein